MYINSCKLHKKLNLDYLFKNKFFKYTGGNLIETGYISTKLQNNNESMFIGLHN